MKMTEHDPSLLVAALAWLQAQTFAFYAPMAAFCVTVLRGLLTGGQFRRTCVEGLLMAVMTWALKGLLLWANLPLDLAVFIGAFCAFIGVERLRQFATSWLGSKAGACDLPKNGEGK